MFFSVQPKGCPDGGLVHVQPDVHVLRPVVIVRVLVEAVEPQNLRVMAVDVAENLDHQALVGHDLLAVGQGHVHRADIDDGISLFHEARLLVECAFCLEVTVAVTVSFAGIIALPEISARTVFKSSPKSVAKTLALTIIHLPVRPHEPATSHSNHG